jgi:hypothetical protein
MLLRNRPLLRAKSLSSLRRLVRVFFVFLYQKKYLTICLIGWDDVGDFSSLADLLPAEANQPRILGESHLGMSYLLIYVWSVLTSFFLSHHRTDGWWHRGSRIWTSDHLPWS